MFLNSFTIVYDSFLSQVWSTNPNAPRKGRNNTVELPMSNSSTISTIATNGNGSHHNGSSSHINGTNSNGSAALPMRNPTSTNPALGMSQDDKRKKRGSYLEAVSMGSLDERSSVGGASVTSEPIDL